MDNSLLAVRVINHKYIVVEKSCTVSVFAIRNFKFLGFALGRNGKGIYVRVHPKPWNKFKSRLKELSSRKRCQSIKPSLEKIKVYARGWLNYYGIASMKNNIDDINGWLYHRIRMCIWKQWKKPRTKVGNLIKMGVPEDLAMQAGNTRRGHWFATHTVAVNMAMTKERMSNAVGMFLRQIVLQRGIPFEMKLPAYEEPVAYGSLTKEQFNAEIEKGMEDIKAGRVYSADEVEAEMKQEFGI